MRPIFLDRHINTAFMLISILIGGLVLMWFGYFIGSHMKEPSVITKLIRVEPATANTLLSCSKRGLEEYIRTCRMRGEPINPRKPL